MRHYDRLPEHLREAAQRYVEHGIPPGSFLQAVFENDLKGAFHAADPNSLAAIKDIVFWMYNDSPCGCQGSYEKCKKWIEHGGLSSYKP